MAAPLGFKTFNSGDVLTAADTNGYLMQGVWTFANAAARTAAVTSPQEGNVSFLKDTNSLEIYDGAAWVAYGSGDITGVTAGTGISGGGTAGDVTITNTMATAIDAKGDLIAGTGADTFSRLAVGANNTVLTADSSTATGLKWATAGANKSYSLISTTALTGSATITVGSLSGYDNFLIIIRNAAGVATSNQAYLRINADTGTNYTYGGIFISAASTYSALITQDAFSSNDTWFPIALMTSGAGQTNFSGGISILGGNSTGFKAVNVLCTPDYGQAPTSSGQGSYLFNGIYKGSAVISSISLISGSGNFSQGNIDVYGAA